MAPPTPNPRRPRTSPADKMATVEMSVAPLFAKRGFDGVTMREIAGASKVPLGSLTSLYPDKQTIYDNIIRTAAECLGDVLIEAMAGGSTATEKLNDFVAALVRLHRQESAFGQILAREVAEGGESRY